MSWLFSQALVEAFSGASSSDGELSAPLSVMPTLHKFWRNDKTMESSRLSQFGLTCAVLTEDRGAALLTWFREAFLARTSAPQEGAQASTGNGLGSGLSSHGSLARFDHASSSWRTPHASLLGDSEEFTGTWPRWGSMRSGACWGRRRPADVARVKGCGWWPRPLASDGERGGSAKMAARVLSKEVKRSLRLGDVLGGPTNPRWSEWLMGWPIGWTSLAPLETDKYQSWLLAHSPCSSAA